MLRWLRAIAVLIGVGQFWITRFLVMSDGISYLDIARNYAAGNWKLAVNAYWSPLLSWLLTPVVILLGRDRRHDLVALHAVQLLVYLLTLAVFDRLVGLMAGRLCGVSVRTRRLYIMCAYCTFYWVGLGVVDVGLTSPDILVLLVIVTVTLLIVRIRTEAVPLRTFGLLGLTLGVGYLAKVAILIIAPVYIAGAILPLNWNGAFFRRMAATCIPLIAVVLLWMTVLRVTYGYWTIGDAGKLNYAWEMCGAARWAHWQGEPGNIGTPLHSTRQLMAAPALYEFDGPIASVATYAPWYDPAYWYAGVNPLIAALSREGKTTLVNNARYLAVLILMTPGLAPGLLLVCYCFCVKAPLFKRRVHFDVVVAVVLPAVVILVLYVLVFVDKRYVGGALLITTVSMLAFGLGCNQSKRAQHAVFSASLWTCIVTLAPSVLGEMILLPRHFIEISDPAWNRHAAVAEEAARVGLKAGDKIGYIGLGIRAYWASVAELRIVSEIPIKNVRNGGTLYNEDIDDSSDVDLFWRSSKEQRDKVLSLFRRSGARAVVSDWVPPGADTRGWIKLNEALFWRSGEDKPNNQAHSVYVLFL
jgi:hypothetical protein